MTRLALIAAPADTAAPLPPPLVPGSATELQSELTKLGLSAEVLSRDDDFSSFDLLLLDTDLPEAQPLLDKAREKETPAVLVSALAPTGPWFLDIEPEARTALIDPWSRDIERRKMRSLDLMADAYADSAKSIAEAAGCLLRPEEARPRGPALYYRGALFNALSGVPPGTCFELPAGKDAILGRGKGVTFVTHSPNIARQHLRMHLHPDGTVETTDLGGTNGNWLCRSGMPAEQLPQGGKSIDLRHGDELAIAGDFRMQYLRG